MAVVNNVILHPTKRRDKRMRALHLCEVGELAGRGPVSHTPQTHANALDFAMSFCMAAVYNVILQHTKRRDKRMRARHLCEVGELAGRAPVSHTLQLHANAIGFARRFVWQ